MRDPLAIASDGYLMNAVNNRTLTIATEGYLSEYGLLVIPVGGRNRGIYEDLRDPFAERMEIMTREDEEIVVIIKKFMDKIWDL